MHERGAHRHLRVEVVLIAAVARHERDDDVGVALLRPDVDLGVRLAPIELREHLVGGVAAPGAVALDLPAAAQVLRRREEDPDVVDVAERLGVEAEQALDDRELPGAHVAGRLERAVAVPVDRLEDRLPGAKVRQVLAEDVEVIAVGMERRDPALRPLRAVVAVVVVGRHVRDLLLAEDAHEPPRERRLARRGVADYAEKDGTRHRSTVTPPSTAADTRPTTSRVDSAAQSSMSPARSAARSASAPALCASAASAVG